MGPKRGRSEQAPSVPSLPLTGAGRGAGGSEGNRDGGFGAKALTLSGTRN